MELVGGILDLILLLAIILLIARFVLDWVQMLARHWRPRGLVLVFCEGLYSITDPPLRAARRRPERLLLRGSQESATRPAEIGTPVEEVNAGRVRWRLRVPRTNPN